MPLAVLPYSVDMSPRVDDQSPSGASGSLSTPASDQRRQFSTDGTGDVQMNGSEDSAGSDGDENGTGNGPRTKKPRISHACQACRRMKIRCEPLEDRNSCRQCAKTNRECLITEPRRKRQKTVHRVAELEKKIEALTATLGSREGQEESLDPEAFIPHRPSDLSKVENVPSSFASEIASAIKNEAKEAVSRPRFTQEDTDYVDVVSRGIVDEVTASQAFYRYHTEMYKFFPVVVFPAATTAEEIRATRPFLFLSILAATVGIFKPGVQATLSDELTWILAEKVMYRGQRSLELVQALLILMVFYSRPQHQKELNFNQTIHIAATMALDLGMGRRSKKGVFKEESLFPGVSVVETRRAWLGCYFMCANAAMSLRHPFFIRWSPYMDESIEFLSTSPDALPSDIWLCELVRLQHIAEDVAFMFSMDDPASVVSLTDAKTQYHMKTFERQIDQWRKSLKSDISQPWIRHIASNIDLYVHEIAIHFDHNVDDFRPPPHMTDVTSHTDFVTPAHIDSLITCMQSIHAVFDAFFEMDTETLRNLPNLFFVRNAYAAVALIKMDGVLHPNPTNKAGGGAGGSKFGSIFAPDLKVDAYLDTMIAVQERAGAGGKCNVAMAFGFVFKKLKGWYLKKRGELTAADFHNVPGSSVGLPDDCRSLSMMEQYEGDSSQNQSQSQSQSRSAPSASQDIYSTNINVPPATAGPTTVVNHNTDTNNNNNDNGGGGNDIVPPDQAWAADHLGFPFGTGLPPGAGISDTTMFNLGLPQFYDFGFTFDDMGLSLPGAAGGTDDASWMGYSI